MVDTFGWSKIAQLGPLYLIQIPIIENYNEEKINALYR